MSISSIQEIEVKLPGENVDLKRFLHWAIDQAPERYLQVTGPDKFWKNNTSVLRHRIQPDGNHELTTKKRKSGQNTKDRLEIDIHFHPSTTPEHITNYLEENEYKHIFTLIKTAHIFFYKRGNHSLTVVLYDVYLDDNGKEINKRRFIEAEIDKGSDITVETAKKNLKKWVDMLQEEFKVILTPLNQSLYEIYSGDLYPMVNNGI